MVRDYPSLKRELENLHEQSITPSASSPSGGNGLNRAVEQIALRQLPGDDQKVYDAVRMAVDATRQRPDGNVRIELISRIYWGRKQNTIDTASADLPISVETAKRWHKEFILTVGKSYGFKVDT